jgi:hypothetical protein
MVETPTDAVPQILIKIQDSISALRAEVGEFKCDNDAQHQRMEGLIRKHRRDSAALMIIMRATISDFDERVSEVVERVAALESAKADPHRPHPALRSGDLRDIAGSKMLKGRALASIGRLFQPDVSLCSRHA